jgi:hypothetical protein
VPRGQRDGTLRPYSQISIPEPLLFLPSSPSVVLTRLSGPLSRPTASQKIWWCRESNPELWICSQELRSLDDRVGPFAGNQFMIKDSEDPLSLVSTTDELLDRKVAAPV